MNISIVQLAWVIPLLPLFVFMVIMVVGERRTPILAMISIGVAFGVTGLAMALWANQLGWLGSFVGSYTWSGWHWLMMGDWPVRFGFEVSPLTTMMLVIVTLIGALVQSYSWAYMRTDERRNTFFGYISLFTFAMSALVISSNLLQMFIFWELVGLCSFLLIGFWYTKPEAREAARKAFIVTRIGDVGLLIGLLLLYHHMPRNSLEIGDVHNAVIGGLVDPTTATWIALCIFIGAIGKSGQLPLHTWLPDAMEGPTPISALIHAATMVAAGVFLVARTYDIFLLGDGVLWVVAVVGALTALLGATVALRQNDLKRILAYSTVSQLGLMMCALGMGSRAAMIVALFHLMTHACFKALLFLAAGAVIHRTHQQDVTLLGGLHKRMPFVAIAFAVGALALAGMFPFAGFWSKETLFAVYEARHWSWLVVAWVVSALTALYMTRAYVLVFTGKPLISKSEQHKRTEAERRTEVRDARTMNAVLAILVVLTCLVGWVYTPWWAGWVAQFDPAMRDVVHAPGWVVFVSIVLVVGSIGIGWALYRRRTVVPRSALGARQPSQQKRPPQSPTLVRRLGSTVVTAVQRLWGEAYFVDRLYDVLIVRPFHQVAQALSAIDRFGVRTMTEGFGPVLMLLGKWGTRMHTGQLQTYGTILVWGVVVLLCIVVGRRVW